MVNDTFFLKIYKVIYNILYMENNNGLHYCEKCNKKYSSYKSLWNHNKNYHTNNARKIKPLG